MKLATYSGLVNGLNKVFSITSAAPISPDHIWPVHNGMWLTRVVSGETNGQWRYAATGVGPGVFEEGVFEPGVFEPGAAAEVIVHTGIAPATGANFNIWTETESTKMLIRERPVGDYDGADRTYTISTAIPAGSEPLPIHNGRILSPTGTGIMTYARVGQMITLHAAHPAPINLDQFEVLVEATKITGALFAVQTVLTGSKNASNRFFTLNLAQVAEFAHIILTNHDGVVYAEDVRFAPDANEFQYDQGSQILELGTAPDSTDDVTYWAIGLTTDVGDPFALWMKSHKRRVILATFDMVDNNTVRTTERHATEYYPVVIGGTAGFGQEPFGEEGFGGGAHGDEYKGLLKEVPRIHRALNSEDVSLVGNGEVVLYNPLKTDKTRELDARFGQGGAFVDGQSMFLEMTGLPTDLSYGNRRPIFRGICRTQRYNTATVTIPIQDTSGRLENMVLLRECTTAEFPSLPVENIGALIPEIWGTFYNLTPILIDPVTLTYLVASHALDNVTGVYNNGVAIPFVFDTNTRDRFRLIAGVQSSEQITCDGRGYRMSSNNIFSSRLGNIIEDILRRKAEYGDIDFVLQRLRMFKNDAPYTVGIVLSTNRKIKEVIRELLQGVPTDLWWSRAGKLILAMRKDPAARIPRMRLQGRQGFNQEGTLTTPIARVTLEYQPIETVQSSGLALSISAERRAFLSKQFRKQPIPNPDVNIRRKFPMAIDEPVIRTRLMDLAEVQAVGALRHSLFGVPRYTFIDEFDVAPSQLDIGDVFDYTSGRYQAGQASPRWLLMEMTEWLGTGNSNSRVNLVGWQ